MFWKKEQFINCYQSINLSVEYYDEYDVMSMMFNEKGIYFSHEYDVHEYDVLEKRQFIN